MPAILVPGVTTMRAGTLRTLLAHVRPEAEVVIYRDGSLSEVLGVDIRSLELGSGKALIQDLGLPFSLVVLVTPRDIFDETTEENRLDA